MFACVANTSQLISTLVSEAAKLTILDEHGTIGIMHRTRVIAIVVIKLLLGWLHDVGSGLGGMWLELRAGVSIVLTVIGTDVVVSVGEGTL